MNARARAPAPLLVSTTVDEFCDILRAEFESFSANRPVRALLDRRGLAEALGVCVDVVDRLRREGAPELTVGDAPRFELERVLEWLRGRASK